MKLAMKDVAKRYPEPWNLANFAEIACAMNDCVVAKEYLLALGDDDGSEAWPSDKNAWAKVPRLHGLVGGTASCPR
jgi:hypothetical protein